MPVVQGTVFEKDNTSGERIPDTRITFTSEDRSKTFRATANRKGSYRLELPAGRYVATASADTYINYSTAPGFVVVQQSPNTFNIFLQPVNKQMARLVAQPMIVDARYQSFQIKDLLKDRLRLKDVMTTPQPADESKPELPLTPDGVLDVGILYDSPNNQNLKYYLPEYVLRIVDTQYTTRLKFRDTDADPHGPVAHLTVEFIAATPEDRRFRLKEIEHTAIARLGYEMAVSDDEPGTSTPAQLIDDFVGEWVNIESNTRGMTRLNIARKSDTAGTFHGFGSCHPEDCDWGETLATFSGEQMTGVYRFGFKDLHMTVRRAGDNLHATLLNDYAEDDRRSDQTAEYILRRAKPRSESEGSSKPTLWIPLGALEKVSQTVRRCQLPIHSKEEYDRLFQIMSDPGHNARVEVRCRATMGYRSWRQIFVGDVFKATYNKPVSVIDLNPAVLRHIQPGIVREALPPVGPQRSSARRIVSPQPARTELFVKPDVVDEVARVNRPTTTISRNITPTLNTISSQPTPIIATELLRVSNELENVVPRRTLHLDAPRRIKVPSRVLVDKAGEPVITRREVTTVQTISPFWFNTETHAYMFDIPETPTTNHVLLRRDIIIDDNSVTFYQDSIIREQIYYEPQAFRLSRTNTEPYAPDLLFAFHDVSEAGEDDEMTVDYRVRLAYRVLPDVDPRFFAQARLIFAESENFTALTPSESSLMLRLPDDENDTWIPVSRSGAEISFDDGIVDEVELTSEQFQKVFSAFQSPATIGIEGTVDATLYDGSSIDIPVQVSLQDNTGTLFDSQFAAAASPGQYNVTLTNRIESPVRVIRAAPVMPGGDAIAHPAGLNLPATVTPGESITITYSVSPPDTPITHITPVLETAIDVDYEQLWSLIAVNQGFVSRTFDVKVSIEPRYFSTTPAGMEPLTSVVVEFDSFVTVELTPEQTALTVPLRMPLLPVLLNQIEAAQSYTFRVINQHADASTGAMSEWTTSSGDLQIVPPRGE